MTSSVYEACPIKKRKRSTGPEMAALKENLYHIVKVHSPMSVRQVFYQAVCRNLVEKSEAGYSRVQRALVNMRLEQHLPFSWIADHTRYRRKPRTFDTVEQALSHTARYYRRALWTDADAYVEIWCEKEALLGVIDPITMLYDVPLMISKGFSSLTFLQATAQELEEQRKPCYLYQFGDHDPSGVAISAAIETRLREFAPDVELHYERVAVTLEQIERLNLPTRPTKRSDSRSKGWEGGSVELDAIPPDTLRDIVKTCIERHIDGFYLEQLEKVEQAERQTIRDLACYLEDVE